MVDVLTALDGQDVGSRASLDERTFEDDGSGEAVHVGIARDRYRLSGSTAEEGRRPFHVSRIGGPTATSARLLRLEVHPRRVFTFGAADGSLLA
jgi:hypothetical protein